MNNNMLNWQQFQNSVDSKILQLEHFATRWWYISMRGVDVFLVVSCFLGYSQ